MRKGKAFENFPTQKIQKESSKFFPNFATKTISKNNYFLLKYRKAVIKFFIRRHTKINPFSLKTE